MILNCGPTRAERAATRWIAKKDRLEQWQPFFAFLPRRVGPDLCVWLEWIRRKGRYVDEGYYGAYWVYEYRLSLLKEANL